MADGRRTTDNGRFRNQPRFDVIRVLVAEDSPTARELLVAILAADPEIQVVGEARDGLEAVALAQRLKPDLVTMDLHMPRMDGFEATKEIMITAPTPIVIVTGSTRVREVRESMDLLRVGAMEVLLKPPAPGTAGHAVAAENLVATVKAMAQVKVVRHRRPATGAPAAAPRRPAGPALPAPVVAVATSTGGPAALQVLLSGLPGDFAAPVLVVQHITPGFTAGLASWLAGDCLLRVKVAEAGEPLARRTVYIAPDDRHLGLSGRAVALSDAPPVRGFRPSGSYLFESVACAAGPSTLALILTGMGDDGVEGLRAVRRAGGRVVAQDEKTSVVYGMPAAAVAAGLVDAVLPIESIAAHLAALV
jgi:two-component system chemotaxis response regulator CheB